ncbi:MAG: AAA family ATPase [Patescibacteria group bacterium]|nr:AAA family ATPase [Patescibacteria group bacterium]MDE1988763.1 AAA family ATPase [Patescibacteria group bacterium]MDE2218663.1 AAA family ATPase [Patescibacteria group bacterium]
MKLNKFRIVNYKAIIDSGECDLLSDKITILAGQNESGKTSILESLRDFDVDQEISPEAKPDGKDNANPEIICEFSIDKSDIEEIENDAEDNVVVPKEIKDEILKDKVVIIKKSFPSNKYSLDDNLISVWQQLAPQPPEAKESEAGAEAEKPAEAKPEPKNVAELQEKLADRLMRIVPYFVYFEGFNDRLPKKKYIEQIANKDEFGYQAVQDFIKLAEIDIERLKTETDDKNIDNYLDGKSANVTGDFLTYWTQKVDGVSQVKIVAERKHDDKGYYLNFFVKDDDSKKYPEQRSKGFLWFLSFYLRLNAESLEKKDIGAVILIDEPGSYLHSKAQADVLKILENKIAKDNQVIFSTHSSDLIDPKRLNRVRLVLNKRGAGTKINKLTARDPGDVDFADALSPIVAAIGKDLGKGFDLVAKKNVLLEGISDYYYLSALRDKTDFKLGQDIKLIPMSGVFKIEYMASLMLGWGLDFVVVMDRDGNSNQEYKVLTEELNIPKDKIFQIEGGKAIEDMFTQGDFKKYILQDTAQTIPIGTANSDYINKNQKVVLAQKFFETYNQSRLTLEQDSKDRFKKIFDFIKSKF